MIVTRQKRHVDVSLMKKTKMIEQLEKLKKHYEEVAGNWDGDTPRGEDEAMQANDIIDAIDNLINLLEDEEF